MTPVGLKDGQRGLLTEDLAELGRKRLDLASGNLGKRWLEAEGLAQEAFATEPLAPHSIEERVVACAGDELLIALLRSRAYWAEGREHGIDREEARRCFEPCRCSEATPAVGTRMRTDCSPHGVADDVAAARQQMSLPLDEIAR